MNNEERYLRRRYLLIYFFSATFIVMIFIRLFSLQIQNGDEYKKMSDERLSLSVSVPAPRGKITDRYGRELVTNRMGYFVVLEKINETEQVRDESILNLFKLCGKDITNCQDELQSITDDFAESLCDKYKIDDKYTEEEKRIIACIRYGMEKNSFSASTPYVIFEDVSLETVMKIKENAELFDDIFIEERPVRKYLYPETAVHILGRVGKISSEEYEELSDDGYKKDDYIGKQGVEKAFEKYLRGTDGSYSRGVSLGNTKKDFVESFDAVPGDSVMLTIDIDLQIAAEKALKNAVENIKTASENGGAVVAIEINSGEILALASYPAYNIDEFNKNYKILLNNKSKPMFNRALSGLYEPGSTFKPITAIASIDRGVLDAEEKILTKGKYEYLDRTFKCNIYKTKGETHGDINVSEAIGVSCNYFFYEIGRRTGIDEISKTAEKFGLGNITCEELSFEEAKGKVAYPENREEKGGKWYPGDVLQAAIGQSDNLFTPLQMANYAATLANGGTNYKTKILKAVKSDSDQTIKKSAVKEIRQTVGASKKALTAVKNGMIKVTEHGGTAASAFEGFSVSVAGKTGSAQVHGGTNGLFICYAPAENPQIALSVVLEKGDSGAKAAEVARKVLESYFEKPKLNESKTVDEKAYEFIP